MPKKTYNVISLLMLNFMFWTCTYYPRHIFETNSQGIAILGVIWNIVFFTLLFAFFYFLVLRNDCLFSLGANGQVGGFSGKTFVKKLALMLVFHIVMDLLSTYVKVIAGSFGFIGEDVFIILMWLIFYKVLTHKEYYKTHKSIIKTLVFVMLIAICISLDVFTAINLENVRAKYNILHQSTYLLYQNYEFVHSLIALALDTLVGCFVIFTLMDNKKAPKKANRRFSLNSIRNFGAFSLNCGILFVIFIALAVPKYLIYPASAMSNTRFGGIESHSGTLLEDYFAESTVTFKALRINNFGQRQQCFESSSTSKIHFVDFETKERFYVGKVKFNALDINYSMEGSTLERDEDFKKYDINGTDVYIYNNVAICYAQDDKPVLIKFEDFDSCEENKIVTQILEKMLTEGNVTAFEYGCQYLSKYNPQFIEPYIERYKMGQFSQNEQLFINALGYNDTYIVNCANNV